MNYNRTKTLRLDLSPFPRVFLLFVLYAAQLIISLWLAYELRFDFGVESQFDVERHFVLLWLIPTQLLLLGLFQQLNTALGFFSTPDLVRMFYALAASSLVATVVWLAWGQGFAPPRGVIVLDFVLAIVGLSAGRLILRHFRESATTPGNGNGFRHKRVAIIGAGDAGAVLAHELSLKRGYGLQPIAFFDDDARKWHSRVHGIPVVGAPEQLLESNKRFGVEEVIIAMPSAPVKRVGEILRILRHARLPCKTVPSLDQLALGQVKVSQLRDVQVQDLLGREKVELATENIRNVLVDRIVLVTGAGGSIGSELCRQIATYHPTRLLLLDRSEPSLFQIEQELIGLGHRPRIIPLVGDILDRSRMKQIFSTFHPQVIFHAAAHKHVPMMESQPGEAVKNNTLGTARLAQLALAYKAEQFILISTDKAINPTSVMGATKRLAELYIQSLSATYSRRTRFNAVRFGNVLGSSGSVIPLFQKQIAEGGPVKVTHPEMTRYFMTIPEASMLVLQSAALGTGGEIFVLDMGKPVKIVDLASRMIELSGLKPNEDIKIEFVGIRPGEKLFEELSHKGENFAATAHPKILRFLSQPMDLQLVQDIVSGLTARADYLEPDEVKRMLKKAVPEYEPKYKFAGRNTPQVLQPMRSTINLRSESPGGRSTQVRF